MVASTSFDRGQKGGCQALAGLLVVGVNPGCTALWFVSSSQDDALAELETSRLLVADLRAGVNAQKRPS